MKKQLCMLLLAALPAITQAQAGGWLKKVNDKIKSKAIARADTKVDQAIDKQLDEIEGKTSPAVNRPEVTKSQEPNAYPNKPIPVPYDFIPGEQVIYSNDFASDNMGELPTGWNSNGSGAVIRLDTLQGNWVQFYQNSTYLTDNKTSFTENFTLEFDLVLRRLNPKAVFPEFTWGILASGSLAHDHNDLLKHYTGTFATEMNIQPSDNSNASLVLQTYNNGSSYLKTDSKKPGAWLQQYNHIIHVSMQVQKERLRIWFNREKLYDLPKAIAIGNDINQLYFKVKRYGGADQEVGYAISNIKIAKGLPDTRHKLVEEGRFTTTGILFNVNAHTILPGSYGVLKEVAAVLTTNPTLSIKVVGHTDHDGKETVNMELSKKRAAAVKQSLVNDFNIDPARIESDGAGESQPICNNTTKECKANNRRVEFIKQ